MIAEAGKHGKKTAIFSPVKKTTMCAHTQTMSEDSEECDKLVQPVTQNALISEPYGGSPPEGR